MGGTRDTMRGNQHVVTLEIALQLVKRRGWDFAQYSVSSHWWFLRMLKVPTKAGIQPIQSRERSGPESEEEPPM
jgi:hypothetical protein